MRFLSRKRLAVLCSLLASTVLLASSGVAAAAATNTQSYSSAEAVQIEALPKAKLLGPVSVELGSATASFDGTKNSYADSYAVSAEALHFIKVNPLHLTAKLGDAPKYQQLKASHFFVDTGTLVGSAEVTDSGAKAVASVSGTKVDPWVQVGGVESSAVAGDRSAQASFKISDVRVRDNGIEYVYVKEVSGEVYASLDGNTAVTINPVEVRVMGVTYTLQPGTTINIPGVARISLLDGSTVEENGHAKAHGGALEIEVLRGILGGATITVGGLDAEVTAGA